MNYINSSLITHQAATRKTSFVPRCDKVFFFFLRSNLQDSVVGAQISRKDVLAQAGNTRIDAHILLCVTDFFRYRATKYYELKENTICLYAYAFVTLDKA